MPTQPVTRRTVLSYLDDYGGRANSIAFAHRRGLRTVRWSYERVARVAHRFAHELRARGINQGERVLLCGENSPEWIAAFWGCILRGAVIVPLDKESTPEFVLSVARQTEAKLMLASDQVHVAPSLKVPVLHLEGLSETVARHAGAPYPVEGISEETLVEIIYTSGTTSQPKGVLLTHRNLLANLLPLEAEIKKYIRWEQFFHPIRFLNLVPLSHVFGQFMGIFVPQLIGGEVHFLESLNPSEMVRATRKNRISVIVLVPRLLDALREWVERDHIARGQAEELHKRLTSAKGMSAIRRLWVFRRLHSLFGWKFWAFISGGASLTAETETFWRRLGFAVLQGYGMTETASLISVNHPFKQSLGSIGKLMPGYEIKLDAGGEIMVRGASVSPGYWTSEGISKPAEEEWLRTGDIGEMDATGNLYFKGRKKDVIVTAAGLNIYPEDLEAALNRQPEVRASCVIAVEGAHGAEPLAVILCAPDEDAEEAVNRANTELAEYQQIRRWFIWTAPDFPRTATHKVLKREVAQVVKHWIKTEKTRVVEAVTDDITSSPFSFILSHVTSTTRSSPARLDSSAKLSDLRLDSLARVELLSALEERYQIEIDEAAFTAATTVRDVEKIIRGEIEERAGAPYPYPKWTQARVVRWIRVLLFYTLVMPITRLMSRMRVRGRSHLERISGPALFISNHVTLADHALVIAGLPARFRHRLAIAMEGELLRDLRYPPEELNLLTRLRWRAQYVLINLFFHVFPLPKQSGFRQSFAYAGECVDRGESVLVFPEGTRAPLGQMHMSSFKTGIGLLARELNVSVVPLKLDGLYELKRRRQYFAAPGEVQVIIGEPVSLDLKMNPAEIALELERRVAALST
ncbi:MAG TPA: AMP-binding protein [Pyrinomonadaceae bacterium]